MNDVAAPSPVEIEDALFKLMEGKGAYFTWSQLDRDDEGPRSPMADALANKMFNAISTEVVRRCPRPLR